MAINAAVNWLMDAAFKEEVHRCYASKSVYRRWGAKKKKKKNRNRYKTQGIAGKIRLIGLRSSEHLQLTTAHCDHAVYA